MLIAPTAAASEHVQATKTRTSDQTVVAFFIAMLVVMLFARLCGAVMPKIRQPRVMGEVLAGIILGPTVFGAVLPTIQGQLFASDIVPYIGVASNLGLIFYMFLIGLEVDFTQLRGRVGMTLAISNTSLLFPLMLGLAAALPLFTVLGPNTRFIAFALFIAVSMSVTAFPVLARIISERRMTRRPLGTLALSAAALNDVSAWFLIALATAVAGAGTGLDVLRTIGEALLYGVVMVVLVRRLLGRAAVAYDEAGRVPGTWITIIFAGVLLSAVVTDKIGVAVIIGGFTMGVVMPRHAGLTHEVTQRVEDFVLTLLLPLFFAYTGLRTNVGLLGRPELILITLGLIAMAIAGKFGGTLVAARTMNLPWRHSAALGAMMNTRGLTELIVLNLALDAGVISPALFTALVVMALVTTLMTGPLMRLIDPRNRFGEAPEEELAAATRLTVEEAPAPTKSILVAPQTDAALEPLLSLALPLAYSEPPRELILLRLVPPPRGTAIRGGLQTEEYEVRESSDLLERTRLDLLDRGVTSRAVAITSAQPGRDLTRLAQQPEIDLVLLDGRRPLLGDGVPRGDVGAVLGDAPCDVAVLVARESAQVAPEPGKHGDGAVRRRRARLGRARARRVAVRRNRRLARAARPGRPDCRGQGRRPHARERRAARAAVRRRVGQGHGGRARAVGNRRGRRPGAAAGRRPVRALGQGGAGRDAAGDRAIGAGADRVRAPRRAAGCAGARHRRHPVRVVDARRKRWVARLQPGLQPLLQPRAPAHRGPARHGGRAERPHG